MNKNYAKEFGAKVRKIRKSIGISQEELGALAGLHRTYIGHVERGEVNPSLTNIIKISNALGVDAGLMITSIGSK